VKLASYQIQTALGRFDRVGALACGTLVDLNSARAAWLAESHDAMAARRHADAVVPPDLIAFLEAGSTARGLAESAVAYVAERTRVNGGVWFDGRLSNWAFTFEQFIAHVSRDETLQVGDFFGSGPPAFSVGFELERWIKPGDIVECQIEGVGTLSNPIVRA